MKIFEKRSVAAAVMALAILAGVLLGQVRKPADTSAPSTAVVGTYTYVYDHAGVLSDKPLFVLINSYTTGLAPSVLGYLLNILVASKYGGKCTWDELGLPVTETGLALPCGATGRWFSE